MINLDTLVLTLAAIGAVLVASEILWRNKKVHGEIARKIPHIIIGALVASTPMFMSISSVRILAVVLLLGVLVSQRINLFRAVHEQRLNGFGELFYALGILLASLITQEAWIITLALLHMSLADGLAAIFGIKYGGKTGRYSVFGQRKTVLGTFTCFGVSTILVIATVATVGSLSANNILIMITLPFVVTIAENLAPHGSDNLLISVMVAGLLSITI